MTSQCRGCGRKILWARTSDGKPIPLDAVAPVYIVTEVESPERGDNLTATRAEHAYVSHFVTCPKRDEFRKPKQKPAGDAEVW